MSENQRVAIVTGAAGGIGGEMTRGSLAAGILVAAVDRDRDPLEALAASAREQGKAAELLTIQTDLASGEGLYCVAIPHIDRQIVLSKQQASGRVDMKGAWVFLWVSMCWIGVGSLLRKIAINLVRRHLTSKASLKGHRLMAAWDNRYMEQVLIGISHA